MGGGSGRKRKILRTEFQLSLVPGKITWQDRYNEWEALFDYCRDNREALEEAGRMTALVLCLQAHWQDMKRLKGESL